MKTYSNIETTGTVTFGKKTTAEIASLVGMTDSTTVFNSDTNKLMIYKNSAWEKVPDQVDILQGSNDSIAYAIVLG